MLFSGFGFGQTKEIDSLKRELLKPNLNDTIRINSYLSLAKAYMSLNVDSLDFFNKKALSLSLDNNNYLLQRVYSNKGLSLIYRSKADSARYYLDKSLLLIETSGDSILKPIVLGNYSMSYQIDNDIKNMAKYNLAAIKASEGNDKELSRLYYNQGIIFGHSDKMEKAKAYFKLSLDVSKKISNSQFEAMSAKGLGHIYFTEGKLDTAKTYLDRSIDLCEKTNNPQICYEAHSKMGELYDLQKKPRLAEASFKKSLMFAKIRNRPYELMAINIFLGQHELKKRKFQKAVAYFEEFNNAYKISPEPTLRYEALRDWAKAEQGVGNYKKSTLLSFEYVKIKDSTYSVENRKTLSETEAKYQTEKKDKEIAEQKLALTESKSKTRTMTLLIVSLLFGSILLWFSFNQRQKRMQQQLVSIEREQEIKTLESLMEGEEKERLRIAKELHDGVNGDLSAIKFKLSSLLEMNNTVIKEAVTMIDNSCEQVRAISHNLVPPSLKDFNLLEAVEEYCQSMDSIHEPEVNFQQVGEDINLDKKQEANLFRIVQELVTNSIKHAEGNEINVQLSHLKNTLQLTVEDNGKGFDPKTVKSDGIGMQNVQSRVDYLNATMDFVSNEKGTSYTITMDTKTKEQ